MAHHLLLLAVAQLLVVSSGLPTGEDPQIGSTPDDVHCFQRNDPQSLRQAWLRYNDSSRHMLHRILEHADHYQRHAPSRNLTSTAPPLRFLEMGVQSGGSARMWKQWHGARLTYVGVDVDAATSRSHRPEEQIFIELGSQGDAAFLRRVCEAHGPFDVVIDDASHVPELMRLSLAIIFPEASRCMKPDSLYVIEDTHTQLRRSHTAGYASDMFNIVGEAFYALHAPSMPAERSRRSRWRPRTQSLVGQEPGPPSSSDADAAEELVDLHPVFSNLIAAVHAYDSIVFFRRAQHRKISDIKRPISNADSFRANERAIHKAALVKSKLNDWEDWECYYDRYPDLASAGLKRNHKDMIHHYNTFGEDEGRIWRC